MYILLSTENFQFINREIVTLGCIVWAEKNGKYFLTGQENSFKELIDLLGDRIANEGVGHDGNINPIGLKLEGIIDILSSKIW